MGREIYYCARWGLRRLFRVMGGLAVAGVEKTPPDGPLIVAANHASYWDPMVLGAGMDRPLHFMARKTLFDIPVFGWLIRQTQAFPLNRDGDSREAIRAFGELLKEGRAVVVFPEGTRSATGFLNEIKAGVGMIATRFDAKVLPVYVWGAFHSWPRGKRFPRRHRMKLLVGDPIAPSAGGESRRDAQRRVVAQVETALLRLQSAAWAGEERPVRA